MLTRASSCNLQWVIFNKQTSLVSYKGHPLPPINADFKDYLIELGWNEKLGKDEYILCPDRTETTASIMDSLSKGFTHYKESVGIKKNISLSNLRKTYITWTNQVLGNDTGLVTSHATGQVLKDYYIDPKVLGAVEKAALEVRVYGKNKNSSRNTSRTFLTQT